MSEDDVLPENIISITEYCRACGKHIEPFMDLGCQPLPQADSLQGDTSARQLKYRLKPAVCGYCGLFQLIEVPVPKVLFQKAYPYATATSQVMSEHFRIWAECLLRQIRNTRDPFVVEIGCNDGTMLRHFMRRGVRHLGIDPASNVAAAAVAEGMSVLDALFDVQVARTVRSEYGQANIIVAANVIAHIPSIMDTAEAVSKLLKKDGSFTFESIYLGDVVRNNMFDQIYAEHVFTFSVQTVQNIFATHGLELVDVQHQNTHGGSMRYTLSHVGEREPCDSVSRVLEAEAELRLNEPTTYETFAVRSNLIRQHLTELLLRLRRERHRIAGYGATAKGATLLNWCGISVELLDFVADNTPAKQGKLMPGTSIPICSPQYFLTHKPDYALLLAWNHRWEIERSENQYRKQGGKWILYMPSVKVL